jgi:uncharacterized protein
MLWRGREGSGNIIDARGLSGTGIALGGGGCGTLIIVILALLFGIDPSALLGPGSPADPNPPASQTQQQRPGAQQGNDETAQFVSVVLRETEIVWNNEFRKMGKQYREPKLVLFSDSVRSACGSASSATGPFYCPGDEQVYLDTSFFRELRTQFRAPGDFAQAYVIAHEIGHHVQNLQGITDQVDSRRGRIPERQYNQLSVALELQADCYAGIFAFNVKNKGLLEAGDAEEALKAASAVGDDNIQRQTQGYVVPDSFTHGTSQQRMQWFMRGFQTGDVRQCNTFSTR